MQNNIFSDKIFYHIYPLGMCGCQHHNDYASPAGNKFEILTTQLDKIKDLGITGIYIGPVFESSAHGYDTVDYFHVDRRLGNNASFKAFCNECHLQGISVVVDTVFNHTGREFFAFKDLIKNGYNSQYRDWYSGLDFSRQSCYGDCFDYQGWAGCMDLVKLNADNPDVRNHLKEAVKFWIQEFDIDGLRMDAADVLSKSFMGELSRYCKNIKENFWVMGEVVHGDYTEWANPECIDSVTNYQIYKALWSCLNERNMFELSYNLDREFGPQGIYNYSALYNFLENHDVNRIASTLKDSNQLSLVYGLLFTIPGVPSIYYDGQYGIRGERGTNDDFQLRPTIPPFCSSYPDYAIPQVDSDNLYKDIKRFISIRKSISALINGTYKNLSITNTSLVFQRENQIQSVIVAINIDDNREIEVPGLSGKYTDVLNGQTLYIHTGEKLPVDTNWMRILVRE